MDEAMDRAIDEGLEAVTKIIAAKAVLEDQRRALDQVIRRTTDVVVSAEQESAKRGLISNWRAMLFAVDQAIAVIR